MAYTPEQFSRDLKAKAGGNLLSVLLYGSAAGEGFSKRFSDFNVMVVLKEAGLRELKAIAPLMKRWGRAGNPAPLLMTRDEVIHSADVFPIEFLDIKARHITLLGEDPISGLEFSTANLRLELEHEFKGKLMRLRGSYLLTEGEPRRIRPLLARSISTFIIFFKAILWMMKQDVPARVPDLIRGACAAAGTDPVVFERVWSLRERGTAEPLEHMEPLMARVLDELEQMLVFIDHYKGGK